MVQATKALFTNYANFKGRTSRRDFWLAYLGYIILTVLVSFVAGFISGLLDTEILSFIPTLFSLVFIIPLLAMEIRRLHDVNKSGWWLFISFVPLVGSIILLVLFCSASVDENNNY